MSSGLIPEHFQMLRGSSWLLGRPGLEFSIRAMDYSAEEPESRGLAIGFRCSRR